MQSTPYPAEEASTVRSLSANYLGSLQFTAEQLATLRKLGEHQGKQDLFKTQTPDVLDTLKQVAVVESTESSNRIEGIVAPGPENVVSIRGELGC